MSISDERLIELYSECVDSRRRYDEAEKRFKELFHFEQCEFFSSPGRTEIIGNHTDHNGGKVIASSISQDTIAVAAPNGSNEIRIVSEGYQNMITVKIDNVYTNLEKCGSFSLIVGIVDAVKKFGFKIAGFSAYISTNVISAAGVSSSASFEMLICSIINYFFNAGKISYTEYAEIGRYAENIYWGKASGMLDQLACAIGGMIMLDFKEKVKYEKIDFSFEKCGYSMIIINSKSNHAKLSDEYSSIPREMFSVANGLGVEKLSDSSINDLIKNVYMLKTKNNVSDRAILRALHFYNETNRVAEMYRAMKENDISKILALLAESGNSSWKYLQNCYVPADSIDQNVALNLSLTEQINKELYGVCRVHGGGFSGVILEVVPSERKNEYISYMSSIVGNNNVYPLSIRRIGAVHV